MLLIHSSIRVDIHTHIQVLSKSSNIFRKLTRWGVQKSLMIITRVHPLIEVLGAIHNPRYIKRVNCREKKKKVMVATCTVTTTPPQLTDTVSHAVKEDPLLFPMNKADIVACFYTDH